MALFHVDLGRRDSAPANSGAYPAPVASAWPIPPMLLALLAIVGVIGVAVLTYAVLSNLA